MKSTFRGYADQFDGTIPPVKAVPESKDAAIVLAKIAVRGGDNLDILEALGLIPTVERDVPLQAQTACELCEWVSSKPKNPALALLIHRRAKHKVVAV